jgi:predicted glycosyltransferase
MDNPNRWDQLFQRLPQIKRSLPWDEKLRGRTDVTTLDNQRGLVSLLKHSAVCMAMSSTMGLDASVLGTPSIGIAYASQPGSAEDHFYRKSYGTEHYAPLIASGGITLVTSHSELISAIQQYVARPETNRDKRENMVRAECGPLDGRSAERIADFLLSRLRKEQ